MSKNLNISVLVAARDEYIEQLKCIITPLVIQGFNSIYQDAIKVSEGKKIIIQFQKLLKEIPQWNQSILQGEAKRIKNKCPYIMDIVTAIFVSNVKILASIRLKGNNDNIKVKIPTSEIFIHSIYIESAQQFYYDPFLFYNSGDNTNFGHVQKNKRYIKEMIGISVDETIRQMLPFDDILQEYLSNALNDNLDNIDNDPVTDEESEEDELIQNKLFEDEDKQESDQENQQEEDIVKNFNLPYDKNIQTNSLNLDNPVVNPAIGQEFFNNSKPEIIKDNVEHFSNFNHKEISSSDSSSKSRNSRKSRARSISSSSSSSSSSSGSSEPSKKEHRRHHHKEHHHKDKYKHSFF